jgi:plasmid maintenance system antidote protein VapI
MATPPLTISEILRKAIQDASVSRYAIAKETGIGNATLCRFLQGENVKSETVDKLANYFGFSLTPLPRVTRLSA